MISKIADGLCLDTPAVVVDLDIVKRNLETHQSNCETRGVLNTPHMKTHKSHFIAEIQRKFGAVGFTCQKLSEAESMVAGGFMDILISYNIVGNQKLRRLASLAGQATLTVTCDNNSIAQNLSQAMSHVGANIGVMVDCDTGRKRTGVMSPDAAVVLAKQISSLPHLNFAGLLVYPPAGAPEGTRQFIEEVRSRCLREGMDIKRISVGGTQAAKHIGKYGETEFRAGTYVYNDRQMIQAGVATLEDCALFVHSTVVSTPEHGRLLLDAGSKVLTADPADFPDYGMIVEYPDARIYQLAEEHGFVDTRLCAEQPEIGEVVRILPNHVCPVSDLRDELYIKSEGDIMGKIPIEARGKVT